MGAVTWVSGGNESKESQVGDSSQQLAERASLTSLFQYPGRGEAKREFPGRDLTYHAPGL